MNIILPFNHSIFLSIFIDASSSSGIFDIILLLNDQVYGYEVYVKDYVNISMEILSKTEKVLRILIISKSIENRVSISISF